MQCSAESVRSKVIAAGLLFNAKKTCNDEGYVQYLLYVSDNNQQKFLWLFIVQIYI